MRVVVENLWRTSKPVHLEKTLEAWGPSDTLTSLGLKLIIGSHRTESDFKETGVFLVARIG